MSTYAEAYTDGREQGRRDRAREVEELTEALQRIAQWCEAYPTEVFHEPSPEECQRAHKLLTNNGMTLDAFSASMARHCLHGIGNIARGALGEK